MSYRNDSIGHVAHGCCEICEHGAHRKGRCKKCPSRSGCNAGRSYIGLALTVLLAKTALVYWCLFTYLVPGSAGHLTASDVLATAWTGIVVLLVKYVAAALIYVGVRSLVRRSDPVARAMRACANEMEAESLARGVAVKS